MRRALLARLDVGEKLCQAYEFFQHLLPSATFGMEQYMVLLFALAERTDLALDFCEGCQGVLLIDLLGRSRRMCSRCRNKAALLIESNPSGGSPPLAPNRSFEVSCREARSFAGSQDRAVRSKPSRAGLAMLIPGGRRS